MSNKCHEIKCWQTRKNVYEILIKITAQQFSDSSIINSPCFFYLTYRVFILSPSKTLTELIKSSFEQPKNVQQVIHYKRSNQLKKN